MEFGYTENPGYADLLRGAYNLAVWDFRGENWHENNTFVRRFQLEFTRLYRFEWHECLPAIYCSLIFTLPLTRKLNFNSVSDQKKFPESFWKCVAYSFIWGYCAFYLILSQKYDYFLNSYSIWDDWKVGMEVPFDILLAYYIECGFYLHSIYATLYMDAVRNDFIVMLVHHVLAIVLLFLSYATRYHKIGILVIFTHDVTDILLEYTKCAIYLKNRNGKMYQYFEDISNIGFLVFAVSWFMFRLYWFPLKIMYSSGVVAAFKLLFAQGGLYEFFNLLLVFLLCLDIYWFSVIMNILIKIATGQFKAVDDTRESKENDCDQPDGVKKEN